MSGLLFSPLLITFIAFPSTDSEDLFEPEDPCIFPDYSTFGLILQWKALQPPHATLRLSNKSRLSPYSSVFSVLLNVQGRELEFIPSWSSKNQVGWNLSCFLLHTHTHTSVQRSNMTNNYMLISRTDNINFSGLEKGKINIGENKQQKKCFWRTSLPISLDRKSGEGAISDRKSVV